MRVETLIQNPCAEAMIIDDLGERSRSAVVTASRDLAERISEIASRDAHVVALLAENSSSFVVGLLGVVRSGFAAMVIDLALPSSAIAKTLIGNGVRTICWWGARAAARIGEIGNMVPLITTVEIEVESSGRKPSDASARFADTVPAIVMFSSGTTGIPKGIVLSHRAITWNACAIGKYLRATPADRFLVVKSMVHSSTLVGEVLAALGVGASVIAPGALSSPSQIIRYIRVHQPTIMGLNPTILNLLLQCRADACDLHSLRLVHVGREKDSGAPRLLWDTGLPRRGHEWRTRGALFDTKLSQLGGH